MDNEALQMSVFAAAKRYWWLVAVCALVTTVGFVAFRETFLDESVASAEVLLDDPGNNRVFDTGGLILTDRFLNAQASLIESPDLIEDARAIAGSQAPSAAEVASRADVKVAAESGLLTINFKHPDGDTAILLANSLARAYEGYRETQTLQSFTQALEGLDKSIGEVEAEIAAIDVDIDALRADLASSELEGQLEAAVADFLRATNGEPTAAELAQVLQQLQTLQTLRVLEIQDPNLALLLDLRREIIDRRSQLVIRRDQLRVEAGLASTGIAAIAEATTASAGASSVRLGLVGLIMGSILGAVAAYFVASFNRRFGHRLEPSAALGVPLLSEVPEYSVSTDVDRLVVLNHPTSPPAEAFRFVGNAVLARIAELEGTGKMRRNCLAVTSAYLGAGKTAVAANTALALTGQGKKILLIDGDFGDLALSRLLLDNPNGHLGLTDVNSGSGNFRSVVSPVEVEEGRSLDLITRGTASLRAGDFFGTSAAKELLQWGRKNYDAVIVDTPPALQVSYASSLLGLTDGAVPVVPHNSKVSPQSELADRFELLGVPLVGYVYNMAPKRSELTERSGSMRNILGKADEA